MNGATLEELIFDWRMALEEDLSTFCPTIEVSYTKLNQVTLLVPREFSVDLVKVRCNDFLARRPFILNNFTFVYLQPKIEIIYDKNN